LLNGKEMLMITIVYMIFLTKIEAMKPMSESDTTTITIQRATHSRLEKMGSKGETFDQIINRLITEPERRSKFEKALEEAVPKIEQTREDARKSAGCLEGVGILESVIKEFLKALKSR